MFKQQEKAVSSKVDVNGFQEGDYFKAVDPEGNFQCLRFLKYENDHVLFQNRYGMIDHLSAKGKTFEKFSKVYGDDYFNLHKEKDDAEMVRIDSLDSLTGWEVLCMIPKPNIENTHVSYIVFIKMDGDTFYYFYDKVQRMISRKFIEDRYLVFKLAGNLLETFNNKPEKVVSPFETAEIKL